MKSSKDYILIQMKCCYQSTLKSFKLNKLFQWLNEWEVIMIECIKYDLLKIVNDHWLRNLTDLVRLILNTFFVWLMKNADDDIKSDSEKFWRMIRKLWERLDRILKNECIFQKNVFQMNFESAEFSEEDSDVKNNQETEQISSKNKQKCKRTETQSLLTNVSKKTVSECSVYDRKEHSFVKCWCIFEELLLKRMKSSAYHIWKVKMKIDKDEWLTMKMQEICWKMNKKIKRKTK